MALAPRDPAGLQAFATAVSSPASPEFRQYLSVGQFAARFGASPAAIAAVQGALTADGLSVGAPTANDLTLSVWGSAAVVERAFSVSESEAQVAGRSVYLNDQAPVLPSSIAGYVQGVVGLDDVTLPQPQQLVRRVARRRSAVVLDRGSVRRAHVGSGSPAAQAIGSGPAPCAAASQAAAAGNDFGGPGSGYTADEIAGAYGLSSSYPGDEGQGQTVALFEQQAYSLSDVQTYLACYGIVGQASITNVNVDGGPAVFNPATDDDGEAALDIEQVMGLAPKANIEVYQAPETSTSALDIMNAMASQDTAKVISTRGGSVRR